MPLLYPLPPIKRGYPLTFTQAVPIDTQQLAARVKEEVDLAEVKCLAGQLETTQRPQ